LLEEFAERMSGFPSKFISSTNRLEGFSPTLIFVVPEKPPAPLPNRTETVLLAELAERTSRLPSKFISAAKTLIGMLPTDIGIWEEKDCALTGIPPAEKV
jgi:hypothetical protein